MPNRHRLAPAAWQIAFRLQSKLIRCQMLFILESGDDTMYYSAFSFWAAKHQFCQP